MTSYASIVEFTHMADIGKRASAQCGSYILISHIMFIEIDILSKKERKRPCVNARERPEPSFASGHAPSGSTGIASNLLYSTYVNEI
jgi:hypothetical protein